MTETYDLVVAGGRVIDPASEIDKSADVAVRDGRIVAIGSQLTPLADHVIDARGCLVTAGLVDAHTHLDLVPGPWGVDARALGAVTGATTWVDAGSAGAAGIAGLYEAAQSLPVEVRALLHISSGGLDVETGESSNLDTLSVEAAVAAALAHTGFVVGFKVRIDSRTVGDLGVEPLRRAVAAARTAELPLMVHVGHGPPLVAEIVPYLDRGDILTHCASGTAGDILEGRVLAPHLRRAHARGVVFDIGHGNGSFAFGVLDVYLEHGIVPLCSSDLNARSWSRGGATLPQVMSKLLASGVPIADVIDATTRRPAGALGLSAGTLSLGTRADISVLRLLHGQRELSDTLGVTRVTDHVVEPVVTLVAGSELATGRRCLPDSGAEPRPSIEG